MSNKESRIENEKLRKSNLHSPIFILNFILHLALFFGAVLLYTLTLHGDVQPADSGEFQIAAITLGIPHPPGYPLFTMLGWLFAQVPIGSPFARVSFLSVIASSLTLVVVSLTVQHVLAAKTDERVRRWDSEEKSPQPLISSPPHLFTREASLPHLIAGLLAALALGLSTTFWAQATTTNIRSLTALFTALMLFVSAQAYATRKASMLIAFAVVLGFGVGHHVSLVFVGAVLGVFVLMETWRGEERGEMLRVLPKAVIAFLLTQLVWLYLPLRDAAGARFAPGNLTTLDGLLFHIFARGFAGDMLAFAAPEFLFDRLALLPTLLTFQFSAPLLVLMALAWVVLIWRRQAIGLAWLIAFALHLFITITYRAPQTVEYALPCWVIACCALAGLGLGERKTQSAVKSTEHPERSAEPAQITQDKSPSAVEGCTLALPRILQLRAAQTFTQGRRSQSALRSGCLTLKIQGIPLIALFSLLLLLIAGVFVVRDGAGRWPSYAMLAQDRSVRADAEAVLRSAPAGGQVLSQWHQATPMWALQDVEGIRSDVNVTYVYPRGAQPYPATFAEQAMQSAQQRPTLITSFFERELAAQGANAQPIADAPAWQIASTLTHTSAPIATFDNRINVNSLHAPSSTVEAGAAFALDLAWAISSTAGAGDAITVRFMRPDGRLAMNADVSIPPNQDLNVVQVRRLALAAPMDLPPGDYDVLAGAYQSTPAGFVQHKASDGREFVPVGKVSINPATQPPATVNPIAAAGAVGNLPRLIGVDYDTGRAGQVRAWLHWQLGTSAQSVTLLDENNQPRAAPQTLSAATLITQPQFLSLAFDVPPASFMRESLTQQVLPSFSAGQRYIPFANQMALIGSSSQRDANGLKLDLHWLAARPITRDIIVSARIAGDGFYQTHDSVPALGAIPTLKWIAGSRVMDRHPFTLNGYAGPLRGTVVVYDSVTQLPLPPLDERYDQGITIPVE